jgi:hypothetical protein
VKPARAHLKITLRDALLHIPYRPIEYSMGRVGIGYRSLLDDPDAIDDFPELVDEPELKVFITEVNGPGRTFETVRLILGHEVLSAGLHRRRLMLGFMFRHRDAFQDLSSCYRFAMDFMQQSLEMPDAFRDEPLLEIQPALLLLENDLRGWVMDLHLVGAGTSEDEARRDLVWQFRSVPWLV